MAKTQDKRITGYLSAFLAAILWGVSGTCAQFLFHERKIDPEWLVSVRLLIAGMILLLTASIKNSNALLDPWKNLKDGLELFAFAILGMLAVQFTYFAAIKHSNAATATILQYLGPVVIACYYSFKEKRLPILRETVAIVFALAGTFLIVTHGSLESLSITPTALFWGLLSAVALATYSIIPINLLQKYDSSIILGWGMLIGGVALSRVYSPFHVPGSWDTSSYLLTGFIIIFGSLIAFYAYLSSVKIVGPTTASLLACAEPLSAAIIAVFWLNVPFGIFDWIGMICILITIGILTSKSDHS